MKKILIIITIAILYACKQREDNKTIPVNMSDTIITENEKAATRHLNEQIADTINMLVHDDKGDYSATGQIDSLHPKIYVKFINPTPGNLKATIKTMQGDGNVRFNQIIFPDKASDGPFGKELKYELKTVGAHQLIIGHSLMAEGQYEGKFKVEIQLSDKAKSTN